jgi:hypothetical protein
MEPRKASLGAVACAEATDLPRSTIPSQ